QRRGPVAGPVLGSRGDVRERPHDRHRHGPPGRRRRRRRRRGQPAGDPRAVGAGARRHRPVLRRRPGLAPGSPKGCLTSYETRNPPPGVGRHRAALFLAYPGGLGGRVFPLAVGETGGRLGGDGNARSRRGNAVHYLLFYDVVPDYVERRAPLRAEHLALGRAAHARGELVLGGALADPVDGAVLLFRGDSPAVAEAFAAADPTSATGWSPVGACAPGPPS